MSSSETDSVSSIQEDFDRLTNMMTLFAEELDALGCNLEKMKEPIENMELAQMVDTTFLENSPFRYKTFQTKFEIHGLYGGKRVPFHKLCEFVRDHLFRNNMVKPDGTLLLDDTIKTWFKVAEPVTYLDLLANLKQIVQ